MFLCYCDLFWVLKTQKSRGFKYVSRSKLKILPILLACIFNLISDQFTVRWALKLKITALQHFTLLLLSGRSGEGNQRRTQIQRSSAKAREIYGSQNCPLKGILKNHCYSSTEIIYFMQCRYYSLCEVTIKLLKVLAQHEHWKHWVNVSAHQRWKKTDNKDLKQTRKHSDRFLRHLFHNLRDQETLL